MRKGSSERSNYVPNFNSALQKLNSLFLIEKNSWWYWGLNSQPCTVKTRQEFSHNPCPEFFLNFRAKVTAVLNITVFTALPIAHLF
jgi:hypothetical protein